MEKFDPRPEAMRNTIAKRLPRLLEDVKGKGLCVSLLFDPSLCADTPATPTFLTKSQLLKKVMKFKKTLEVSEEDIRRIQNETRGQSTSPLWFEARRLRLTASLFGRVTQLKPSTLPDNLVLTVLGVKTATGAALSYGRSMEATALDAYVKYQQAHGHPHLLTATTGVIISHKYPFLAASPDATVYDPSNVSEPYGFVEIKCPFKYQDTTPTLTASKSDFFLKQGSDGHLVLKESHVYFSQVQGQMGVGKRMWRVSTMPLNSGKPNYCLNCALFMICV